MSEVERKGDGMDSLRKGGIACLDCEIDVSEGGISLVVEVESTIARSSAEDKRLQYIANAIYVTTGQGQRYQYLSNEDI